MMHAIVLKEKQTKKNMVGAFFNFWIFVVAKLCLFAVGGSEALTDLRHDSQKFQRRTHSAGR